MIPIVVLLGLVIGRWWSVPVLAVAWGALVYGDGVAGNLSEALAATSIAAANTIAAVGLRQWIGQRRRPDAEAIAAQARRRDTHVLSFLRLDPSA